MSKNGTNRGIILFMILLITMVVIVFLGTEVFHVEDITVVGNHKVDNAMIIRMSGINIGDNIFKINKSVIKRRLEENPPFLILNSVSFKLPDRVVVSVAERIPAAVITYLSSYVVIDKTGFILDIIKQEDDVLLPVIEGIRIKSFAKGRDLEVSENDSYKFRVLLSVIEVVYKQDASEIISSINVEDADKVLLKTRDGIDVFVGQAVDLDKKISWLLSDAYDIIISEYSSGTFNISVKEPIFIKPEDGMENETED